MGSASSLQQQQQQRRPRRLHNAGSCAVWPIQRRQWSLRGGDLGNALLRCLFEYLYILFVLQCISAIIVLISTHTQTPQALRGKAAGKHCSVCRNGAVLHGNFPTALHQAGFVKTTHYAYDQRYHCLLALKLPVWGGTGLVPGTGGSTCLYSLPWQVGSTGCLA